MAKPTTTRTQILDAAMACFEDRGYEETSIHDIAERAGVSEDAIRQRFADRREILLALFEVWSEHFSRWMASA